MVRSLAFFAPCRRAFVSCLSFILTAVYPCTGNLGGAAEAQVSTNASSSSSTTKTVPDPADLEVSWRKMPARFLHDQKDMWLFPTKLGKAKNWIPHGDYHWGHSGVHQRRSAARTQGAADRSFYRLQQGDEEFISGGLITVVPVGFYVLSLIRHDSYGQGTGLLAGEAVLNDTVLM